MTSVYAQPSGLPRRFRTNVVRLAPVLALFRLGTVMGPQFVFGDGDASFPCAYPYWLLEDPKSFTMLQVDETFLSSHRLLLRAVRNEMDYPPIWITHVLVDAFFFLPLTHEEAHRSVLSSKGIGAVSRPWFDADGTARVIGVRDEELRRLRDTDFPTFIRLHTAGLESDMSIAVAAERLAAWKEDETELLWTDHALRRLSVIAYFATGLLGWNPGIEEEEDELDRDIVGHDVYGAARHLHRPDMPFRRYTEFDDLTPSEKAFVRRVGRRSFLNLGSPLLWGYPAFSRRDARWAASFAYYLAPFGDVIEQNVWVSEPQKWGVQMYIREMQNEDHWFAGFGVRLAQLRHRRRIALDVAMHGWRQPEELDFRTARGDFGGALEVGARVRLTPRPSGRLSARFGVLAKTKGFLPEAPTLDADWFPRLGFVLTF